MVEKIEKYLSIPRITVEEFTNINFTPEELQMIVGCF